MTQQPPRATGDPRGDDTEVQHFGPASRPEEAPPWPSPAAWSSRPSGFHAAPPPPPRRGPGALPVIGIAIVAGVLSGALSATAVTGLLREPAVTQPIGDNGNGQTVSDVRIDESSAVIEAVRRVTPAVVTIQSRGSGLLAASGSGSGFIFHADGWILTNRHVVQNADEVTVVLNDGTTYPAETFGIDTLTDLAILKVDAGEPLPTAPIGTSSDLEPGQLAIAIGNPLGTYENTVTTGVVSGLGRQITAADAGRTTAERLTNLIQTDAAINPGNSGGPLVNSAGQVIGVNTAVSQEAQGLSFSIPIDVAKPIMSQAIEGRDLARPWIGVYYQPITPALASTNNLPVDYGALLTSTQQGQSAIIGDSPAAEAGLQDGDIIVSVDGERVEGDLSLLLLGKQPGETVSLRILRGSSTQNVEVTLGELPQAP